jgi:hypothetical protein
MMIAMAILSGALTWLVVGMSRNITAENHAKLMSTATFLARERMVDFEDELYEKGFGEFEKELSGNFEEKGFARFTWKVIVDKVELPSAEQIQTVMTKAQENKNNPDDKSKQLPPQMQNSSSSASNNPLTAGAGALASQFGIIKDVLEQGIRRVTVKILWKEGKIDRDVTVIAYYTDVRKVDQAIQIAAQPPGGPSGPSGPSK